MPDVAAKTHPFLQDATAPLCKPTKSQTNTYIPPVPSSMLGRTIFHVAKQAVAPARRTFAAEAAATSSSLVINFTTPHAPVFSDKVVDKVILPGEDGDYGVTAGHSPIISQLKPGVVTVIHTNVRFPRHRRCARDISVVAVQISIVEIALFPCRRPSVLPRYPTCLVSHHALFCVVACLFDWPLGPRVHWSSRACMQGESVKYFVSGGFAITHKDSPVTVRVIALLSRLSYSLCH